MHHVITQKELFEIAQVKQKGRLMQWLNEQGIRYKLAANGEVFTTPLQLNASFTDDQDEAIVFGYGQD